MPEQSGFPEVAKWTDLYPESLKDNPTSFSECLLAITSRFRSFFRKINQDVKPVWITGIVTGISKYQEDRWYVDLRGPEDGYIKANVNPKSTGIDAFEVCDTLILEGKFAFISRPNHLDQIQIQIEVIQSLTVKSKVSYLKRVREKKLKPDRIERIGIITSPNGRALSDFHSGFGEYLQRNVSIEVEEVELGKSGSILERIREADSKGYDVLVITRGGGIDLDLFNLPTMLEALRQCKSFTLSALGHADDNMVFDWNADMSCSTPTAAGNELQKQINMTRKAQRLPFKTENLVLSRAWTGAARESITEAKPSLTPKKSWLTKAQAFINSLEKWAIILLKATIYTAIIIACTTILLYMIQKCAIPVVKNGKAAWESAHEMKTLPRATPKLDRKPKP